MLEDERAAAAEKLEGQALLTLITRGAEGNVSHPLFDRAYYLRNNPDVAASGIDPLVHYGEVGAKQLRNPHALFDAAFYAGQHPEVRAANADPLIHFLVEGARHGYNPNHYFDIDYYLWRHPEAKASGMNPLIHYLQTGWVKGFDPHPLFGIKDYLKRYPDIAKAGTEPLSHYLEFGCREKRIVSNSFYFSERIGEVSPLPPAPVLFKSAITSPVPVFCVYGPGQVEFIHDAVIPAFANQQAEFQVSLDFVNYRSKEALIKSSSARGIISEIKDWSTLRPAGHLGFGQGVNHLFSAVRPAECFLLCNPDSFPMPDCLRRLMETYLAQDAAIVEARQWPSAHPKEFDTETLETPWASGAFDLISSKAFEDLGGFDLTYFLYMEDVDLSWRAWLRGYRVLHQPLALCAHSTGLHSYSRTRFYYEHFFSLRNFLVISYKFFGDLGERIAVAHLRAAKLPNALYANILESYRELLPSIAIQPAGGYNIDKIKIAGLNLFHEFQQ